MRFVSRNLKFGNIRNEQSFTIYPSKFDAVELIIQSSKRIVKANLSTGKATLSKQCQNGAFFHHLSKFLGATEIDLTNEQLDILEAMRDESTVMNSGKTVIRLVG